MAILVSFVLVASICSNEGIESGGGSAVRVRLVRRMLISSHRLCEGIDPYCMENSMMDRILPLLVHCGIAWPPAASARAISNSSAGGGERSFPAHVRAVRNADRVVLYTKLSKSCEVGCGRDIECVRKIKAKSSF